MGYNAIGDVLQPIVFHGGEIVQKVEENFAQRIGFIKTGNGLLTYDGTI